MIIIVIIILKNFNYHSSPKWVKVMCTLFLFLLFFCTCWIICCVCRCGSCWSSIRLCRVCLCCLRWGWVWRLFWCFRRWWIWGWRIIVEFLNGLLIIELFISWWFSFGLILHKLSYCHNFSNTIESIPCAICRAS